MYPPIKQHQGKLVCRRRAEGSLAAGQCVFSLDMIMPQGFLSRSLLDSLEQTREVGPHETNEMGNHSGASSFPS